MSFAFTVSQSEAFYRYLFWNLSYLSAAIQCSFCQAHNHFAGNIRHDVLLSLFIPPILRSTPMTERMFTF